jgi:hypothetical protein
MDTESSTTTGLQRSRSNKPLQAPSVGDNATHQYCELCLKLTLLPNHSQKGAMTTPGQSLRPPILPAMPLKIHALLLRYIEEPSDHGLTTNTQVSCHNTEQNLQSSAEHPLPISKKGSFIKEGVFSGLPQMQPESSRMEIPVQLFLMKAATQ